MHSKVIHEVGAQQCLLHIFVFDLLVETMDPIAMANSAVKVLNQVKKALDECKEAFEEAKDLKKAVDLFEVTIMMIPNKAQPGGSKTSAVASAEVTKIGSLLGDAKDATMDRITDMISESPLGVVMDLFKLSPTGEPIFGDGPSPAATLQDMKNVKVADIRVYSDLDVMFAGMAFIISSALESMSEATETLQKMNSIGEPSYLWLCTPWKIMQMQGVKKTLSGHFESLVKQTVALQSAIGVASYAVQLEQLENTLDATSVLINLDMRDLWKKKLGIDRTRVPFSEFCDAFLSAVRSKVKEVRVAYLVDEKVGRFRAPCDVVLARFLNELYNEDNDDYISAFELSHALDAFVPKGSRSVPYTADHLLKKEVEFLNFIKFQTVQIPDEWIQPSREDPLSGLVDSSGEVKAHTIYPYADRAADGVIVVRPFHRLLLRADVPVMDEETFPFDHLIMLKYRYNPIVKLGAIVDDDVDEVSEMKHTKTFVHEATNELMLGKRESAWNAFRCFVRVEGDTPSSMVKKIVVPPGFHENVNFELIDPRETAAGGGGGDSGNNNDAVSNCGDSDCGSDINGLVGNGGNSAAVRGGGKVKSDPFIAPTRILYSPYLLEPGYYSPRFCVDAYDGDPQHKQKMAKSAKSYYRSCRHTIPFCPTVDDKKEKSEVKLSLMEESKEEEEGLVDPEELQCIQRAALERAKLGLPPKEMPSALSLSKAFQEQQKNAAYNASLGVLVKCVDVLELVFAEDISLEWLFHEDGDDSDNDIVDGDPVHKLTGFRPQLSSYYPYLPDRLLEGRGPMDVGVYVNIPSNGKKNADLDVEDVNSPRSSGNGAGEGKSAFVPSKIALFLCPGEVMVEKSVKSVNSRTKRYKYSKSLLKEVMLGAFGGDTGVKYISYTIGFVDATGRKRLPCSPGVTLAFLAASTETLEETETDEIVEEDVETEQEEPEEECTEKQNEGTEVDSSREPTSSQAIPPVVKKIPSASVSTSSSASASASSASSQKISKTTNGNAVFPKKHDSNGKAGSGSVKATASSPKASTSASTSSKVLKPSTTSNKETSSSNAEKKTAKDETVAPDVTVTPAAHSRVIMAPLANISRTSSMRLAPTPSALSAPRGSTTFTGSSGQSNKNLSPTISAAPVAPSVTREGELQKEVSVKQRVLQLEEVCNTTTASTNSVSRDSV